jgi:hypothetical protein
MSTTARAVHAAVVVVAGLIGVVGSSSAAAAQRGRPATAAQPTPHDSRRDARSQRSSMTMNVDSRQRGGEQRGHDRFRNNQRLSPTVVYYVPVPVGYGGGGGVYDTDGRPLYEAYERQVTREYGQPVVGTPDLSGSSYVVAEGGVMIVDVGDGQRRSVASCAALSADATPDGHPRTVFYQPPADGIILREGSTGRVRGTPPATANACYGVDAYGRTELRY